MGCWNGTCGFSNLPITDGMPVRAMFIKPVKESRYEGASLLYAFDLFHPATIMIKSTYNDYGWINVTAEEIFPFIANVENMGLDISFRNEENGFLPDAEDVSLWMIREDVYQMLRDIPLDHWGDKPKFVGEYIDRLRIDYDKLATEIRTELTNNTEKMGIWSFELRDRMNRLFGRSEMARWPLMDFFSPNSGIDLPPENVDEIIDILQIFSAMNALRKNLVPTIGGGSQDYNEGGYRVIANFMNNAMDEYRKQYDYWEDEEEEA